MNDCLKKISLLICCVWIIYTGNAQNKITPLKDVVAGPAFKNPPIWARPKALWPWVNGNFSLSQITFELEQAKQKGIGTPINSGGHLPIPPTLLQTVVY